MDALDYFGVRHTESPCRWELDVVPALCSRRGAMFGGCAMAAAVDVVERVTGRPLVWATGQFLTSARPPAVLVIDVVEVARGRQISQARLRGTVEGMEVLAVNAALGRRPHVDLAGSWEEPPVVPPPDACRPRQLLEAHDGTMMDRLDMRMADGRDPDGLPGPPGSGRSAMWVRVPELTGFAAMLALIGDFVPFGVSQATGQRAGGNSLDNTLRVVRRPATEWILADVRMHAVVDGFAHGLIHLWSEDGRLLGTASQTAVTQPWEREES